MTLVDGTSVALYGTGFIVCWFVIPMLLRKTIFSPAICKNRRRLDGKVVLITGANTGLGKVTAGDMAARGAVVYMACRNMEKAEEARQEILASDPEAKLKLLKLDLNSLKSVKECADSFLQEENTLDILIANAGFGAFQHKLTEDEIEWHLGCNHLSHFYLTRLLMPCLTKAGTESRKSRIVVVASIAHKATSNSINYEQLQKGTHMFAYAQSKLANILFASHLNKLLSGRNVTVNSLHPGTVDTEFTRNYFPFPKPFFFPFSHMCLTSFEGSQTQIWAAVEEKLEGVSGKFFSGCALATPSKGCLDDEEAEKLWRWSCSKTRLPLSLDLENEE